jgi:Lysyl oxidase
LSPCHGHYHFKYYGQLGLSGSGSVVNGKLGFCLQSTNRVANRETSPLHNEFASCYFQGVEAGWVDQYKAGLPNQWLDTTTIPTGAGTRSFLSNPNGFLCEGTFVDANGNPLGPGESVVWAPTGLTAENGEPVEAPLCRLIPTWDENNSHSVQETIEPHGLGLITSACTRGQIGPLRNCGFGKKPVTVSCRASARQRRSRSRHARRRRSSV